MVSAEGLVSFSTTLIAQQQSILFHNVIAVNFFENISKIVRNTYLLFISEFEVLT